MDEDGAVKRMKKEDRRQQILDSAMTVFVEKGFNGSTTLEIAKAANVSEVTLFRYFSSKQEIFLQGIEPILISTLQESVNTSVDLSAQDKLEYILYERISLISKNYKVVKLILAEAPLLSELGTESFMTKILKILNMMLAKTGIPKEDNELTLRLLMGSILSFLYMPEMDEENIRDYVKKIVNFIVEEQINQRRSV